MLLRLVGGRCTLLFVRVHGADRSGCPILVLANRLQKEHPA
ncbi:hypothetical protein [Mesorhizobium sp. M0983]